MDEILAVQIAWQEYGITEDAAVCIFYDVEALGIEGEEFVKTFRAFCERELEG